MQELQSAWDQVTRDFRAACSQAAQTARSETVSELNQTLRRFRQYRTETEWLGALLDGLRNFVPQAAVFSVEGDTLRLLGKQNLELPEQLAFPVNSGRAFANAILTKDPVVALCTPDEVSRSLSFGGTSQRAHLIPIANGSRVVAVLLATGDDAIDSNALELMAGMASLVLERLSNTDLNVRISPLSASSIAPTPIRDEENLPAEEAEDEAEKEAEPERPLPVLSQLKEEDRNRHLRARRFARVRVAEMQLLRPDACRAGREQNNVYLFLKKEIESAREQYRNQFMTVPFMADYLHLELVRAAAEGDEARLGADYPGRLG